MVWVPPFPFSLHSFLTDYGLYSKAEERERPGWEQKSLARKHITDRFCRR